MAAEIRANLPDIVADFVSGAEVLPLSDILYEIPAKTRELERRSNIQGVILGITGPSGAGKDSVIDHLGEKLVRWRTCTTRPPRPGELASDPYNRLSIEEFEKAREAGAFVECEQYDGNWYGTRMSDAVKILDQGRIPVLRVDPRGARTHTELWLAKEPPYDSKNFIHVYILPPSIASLRGRIAGRDVDLQMIERRMQRAMEDLKYAGNAHYLVINNDGQLARAAEAIMSIVKPV